MSVCPIDMKPCCDDICHGAGCVRSRGQEMIEICHLCQEPMYEGECECSFETDYDHDD